MVRVTISMLVLYVWLRNLRKLKTSQLLLLLSPRSQTCESPVFDPSNHSDRLLTWTFLTLCTASLEGHLQHHSLKNMAIDQAAKFDMLRVRTSLIITVYINNLLVQWWREYSVFI